MKNVVFVMNNIGDGGAERVGVTVAKYMAAQGYHVSIARMSSAYNDYSVTGIQKIITLPNSSNKYLKHFKRLLAFQKFCREDHTDVVIVMGVGDMMLHYFKKLHPKVRLILSERNDPGSQYSVDRVLGKRVNRFLALAERVVFQTEDAKNYFDRSVQERGVIIPNPIRNDLPEPFSGVRRKEIVNFCRLNKQKNLPLLFQAFEKLREDYPDYTLRIYGRGELKKELTELMKTRHLEGAVFLEDFAKDIHQKIRDAAMFVSSSDFEGISNSMLEAMAIGLPVVCTDCPAGGARMMIEHERNGLLVPVGNAGALYRGMKYMIEHPAHAKRMSEEAVGIRQRLAEDMICQQWVNLL